MKRSEFLSVLSAVRTREVVVVTMSAAREWPRYSCSSLDLVYVPSAMGEGPSLALGIALAKPRRRVVVVNGDGCTLMNLGVLVTIADVSPRNLVFVNMDNGVYEMTGGQAVPGAGRCSFVGLARGAGWSKVYEYRCGRALRGRIRALLSEPGPVFVNVKVDPEPGDAVESPDPIFERIARLARALAGRSPATRAFRSWKS